MAGHQGHNAVAGVAGFQPIRLPTGKRASAPAPAATQDLAAVEHDRRLLELLAEAANARMKLAGRGRSIGYWVRQSFAPGQQMTEGQRFEAGMRLIEAKIAEGDAYEVNQRCRPSEALADYQQAVDAVKAAGVALDEHESGYGGWGRYFLVVSSDGHIHRSMSCSTCNKGRKSTEFALLPDLSDCGTATAVEALGAALCSVCFPDAPTDQVEQARVPARLVGKLLSDGEAVFRRELDAWRAKQAKTAAARCPGSGTSNIVAGSRKNRYPSPIGTCGDCGQVQTLTPNGLLRAHKGR